MDDFIGSYWPILLLGLWVFLAFAFGKKGTFYHWAARITAICDLIFLAYFNLGTPGLDQALIAIPIVAVLVLAWRNDLVGAVGFLAIGVFFLAYFEWGDFPIGVVPIIIAAFFLIGWRQSNKPRPGK